MRPPLHLPLHAVTAFLLFDIAVAEAFGRVVYNYGSTCVGFNALPACFGPPLPSDGLMGYLIEGVPANACDPMEGPPASDNSSETFIALIRRSDCPFGVKVLHAQQVGYQAAIVHNVNAEQLVNMITDDKEIRQQIAIQSVFIGESAYKHLKRASRYEKGAYVTIMAPKQPHNPCQDAARPSMWDAAKQYWPRLLKYSAYNVIPYVIQEFGFMINVVICTISLVVCALWYKKGRKTTVCTFERGDKYDTCVICMAEYEDGDQLKILPCSHAYHCACIDTWLHTQPRYKTCPFCKQQVTTEAQDINLDTGRNPQEQAGEEEDHAEDGEEEDGHGDESVEGEEEDDQSVDTEEGYEELEKDTQ
ncbi:E3 ubiquitin-protein ligase RNF13-like [Emydura macquarii macquarii]|uniref:E3 ubiquitin-protein ligase RNF13-like n=1 Tax=Emydura macquarii macquarii TaxID=1129001 RepID=UPI00352AABBB